MSDLWPRLSPCDVQRRAHLPVFPRFGLTEDGISTEVVENAAARLSGQQVAKVSRYPPGKPTDDFITQGQFIIPLSPCAVSLLIMLSSLHLTPLLAL